jgi:hypothetical protein
MTRFFKQQSYRIFTQIFELLMFRTCTEKLIQKTSFRATDLNYEINLFRFCFFYAKNSNHKHMLKEGCPQSADCAVPDSKPLRGVLFTTGGDDCPTQAEKLPNRTATVTKTARVYPRAEPRQGAGTRVLRLSRPQVCSKAKKKNTHSQSSPEKDFWY